MPELPEVETVRRSLLPFLVGRTIRSVTTVWPRVVEGSTAPRFRRALSGRRVLGLSRRAKYLVVELDRGRLVIHLRMTGKLIPVARAPRDRKHVSALLTLDEAQPEAGVLIFHDVRRFGRLQLFEDDGEFRNFAERFGPEPLDRRFTPERLVHSLHNHRRLLKALLLDQEFVAGLGNIYVDEALWEARLHPLTPSHHVSTPQATALHAAIRKVLRESIRRNGTTFLDFKFLGGQRGGYTEFLRVFRRQGEPCPRCGRTIRKLRVAGRGTHVCETCQRPPKPSRRAD